MKPMRSNLKNTLTFHRELYERRLQRIQQRGGLTEREAAEKANDPSLFRRGPKTGSPGEKARGAPDGS